MNTEEESKIVISSDLDNVNEASENGITIVNFFRDLISYISFRSRQTSLFLWALGLTLTENFSEIKAWTVRRMYWGRGSLYRSAFHVIIFSITIISLIVGLSNRINIARGSDNDGLLLSTGVIGYDDTLYQTGTTESITAIVPTAKNWPEYTHIVKAGETLEQIAKDYGVSVATIKWSNNLTSDKLKPDQILSIPGLNGVLYTVKKGDTVDSIVNKSNIKNANSFDIIELNNLVPPNFTLSEGQQIFIPNGIVTTPIRASAKGSYLKIIDPGIDVPPGTFVNPLTFCPGYKISRGVLPYHPGVDMPKAGGCIINSAAAGKVTAAEWAPAKGFHVEIDHGNGFQTHYYHGNGEFYVRKGDNVLAGQKIMYMGCTGNCTGTHLHFEMHYNGQITNPEKYIKLR